MADLKELTLGFFGKTLNITDDEVAALLFENADEGTIKDGALENLLAKDSNRIQKFKDERQTYYDNGFKKAQKESLSKLEEQIKETFEISSDAKGIDLIQEIVNTKVSSTENFDEEKVKVHPLFTKTVNELTKKIKDTEGIWEQKFDAREKDLAKQNTFQDIKNKARLLLENLKPILPSDSTKADKQLSFFYNELNGFEFENQDGTIIIMKDGKLLEDKHGNRINFDAFIKDNAATIWDFQTGTAKTGTGNGKDGKTKDAIEGQGQDIKAPKDKAEFSRMIAEAKTSEERIAIADAFEKAQSAVI